MRIMGHTILMKIIMVSNTPPRIITIPITLIRMATITIPTRKDIGDTQASDIKGLPHISEAEVAPATVAPVTGAGTEVWKLRFAGDSPALLGLELAIFGETVQ